MSRVGDVFKRLGGSSKAATGQKLAIGGKAARIQNQKNRSEGGRNVKLQQARGIQQPQQSAPRVTPGGKKKNAAKVSGRGSNMILFIFVFVVIVIL